MHGSQNWDLERGDTRAGGDTTSLFMMTMRYSLRRALSLDSVDGGTHNPTVGLSNPPPSLEVFKCFTKDDFIPATAIQMSKRLCLFCVLPNLMSFDRTNFFNDFGSRPCGSFVR
jgi:hypothetical protein